MSWRLGYCDFDGVPCTFEHFLEVTKAEAERIGREGFTSHKRIVARDQIDGNEGHDLSTVNLMMNHGSESVPLFFETMRFPLQDFLRRYSTKEEAERGHKETLAQIRALGLGPNDPAPELAS